MSTSMLFSSILFMKWALALTPSKSIIFNYIYSTRLRTCRWTPTPNLSFLKALIDGFWKVCKIIINNDGPSLTVRESTLMEAVLDNMKRRDVMGDKGGKKDKEKGQKQNVEKQKQKSRDKLDKQPKRKPWSKITVWESLFSKIMQQLILLESW